MNTPAKTLYEKLKRFRDNTSGIGTVDEPEPMPVETKPFSPKPSRIPNKLLNIPGVVKASNLDGIRKQRETEKEKFLQTLGLDVQENSKGAFAYRDTTYSSKTLLYQCKEITGRELVIQSKEPVMETIQPEDILFIDTETTGLAGGTGTVPFLIGAGYFEGNDFIIRQYFMRDFPDEPAVLHDFEDLLRGFKAVSSFNGKCFDVPLIHARYMMNRMNTRILDLPHVDLLYPARRFWRNVLPDCRLGTIEEQILGHKREGDIPGELIPYVYFDFVRGQRLERMKPVLHHNNEDIATLAMMTARICCMLREPLTYCHSAYEMAGAAKCLDEHGMLDDAVACFKKAAAMACQNDITAYQIRKQFSALLKRENRIAEAVEHWREMAEWDIEPHPRIELAKYLEHTAKDFAQALIHTEAALQQVTLSGMDRQNGVSLLDLEHRRARLLRKLNGIK